MICGLSLAGDEKDDISALKRLNRGVGAARRSCASGAGLCQSLDTYTMHVFLEIIPSSFSPSCFIPFPYF